MQRPARLRGDAGAAVVDFAMMSVLLVLLLFAVLQVAVYVYERNIVAASAADAARYAASAGSRSRRRRHVARPTLIAQGLTSADARLVPCTGAAAVDRASGLSIVRVHCSGRMRLLLLPFPVPLGIDVTGSALQEHDAVRLPAAR